MAVARVQHNQQKATRISSLWQHISQSNNIHSNHNTHLSVAQSVELERDLGERGGVLQLLALARQVHDQRGVVPGVLGQSVRGL